MPVAREEHVVAGHEVVGGEHPVEVVAGVERGLAFLVVARATAGRGSSPPMHWSAQAAITPSGVPPMPKRMSVPLPGRGRR